MIKNPLFPGTVGGTTVISIKLSVLLRYTRERGSSLQVAINKKKILPLQV